MHVYQAPQHNIRGMVPIITMNNKRYRKQRNINKSETPDYQVLHPAAFPFQSNHMLDNVIAKEFMAVVQDRQGLQSKTVVLTVRVGSLVDLLLHVCGIKVKVVQRVDQAVDTAKAP